MHAARTCEARILKNREAGLQRPGAACVPAGGCSAGARRDGEYHLAPWPEADDCSPSRAESTVSAILMTVGLDLCSKSTSSRMAQLDTW